MIPSFRPMTAITRSMLTYMRVAAVALLLLLLVGCATTMTVDTAKESIRSLSRPVFVPPPREAKDIVEVLHQSGQFDPGVRESFMKQVKASPPQGSSDADLIRFYYQRGEANRRMGFWKQALDDLRIGYTLCQSHGWQDASILFSLSDMEGVFGNVERSLEIAKERMTIKPDATSHYLLQRRLARSDRYNEAEELKKKGLLILQEWKDKTTPWYRYYSADFQSVSLGYIGKHKEAEPYLREEVRQMSKIIAEHPHVLLSSRRLLAGNLVDQGRLLEAEVEIRRAISESLGLGGIEAERTSSLMSTLSRVLIAQGRVDEASHLSEELLRTLAKLGFSGEEPIFWQARTAYGNVLAVKGDFVGALKQYGHKEEKSEAQEAFYDSTGFKKNSLAILCLAKVGRCDEALDLATAYHQILSKRFGSQSFDAQGILALEGVIYARQGNPSRAWECFSKSVPSLNASTLPDDYLKQRFLQFVLEEYLDFLAGVQNKDLEVQLGLTVRDESFAIADRLRSQTVGGAIYASAARAAVEDKNIQDLTRLEQDALHQINSLEGEISDQLVLPANKQDEKLLKRLEAKVSTLRQAREIVLAEIKARFDRYSQFTQPKPATISEVREFLRPAETLLSIYSSQDKTYLWTIAREGPVRFLRLEGGEEKIRGMVAHLRRALDPEEPVTDLARIPTFDLDKAHELYRWLLMPAESDWKGARDLIVICTGALGQLPLSILPTEPCRIEEGTWVLFEGYEKVPWLIRKVSLSRLPSASAFVSLRRLKAPDPNRLPLAGFGDPLFGVDASAESVKVVQARGREPRSSTTRRLVSAQRGKIETRSALPGIEDLPPLPDTAEEILGIAQSLGADPDRDVFLGREANEQRVKTMKLSDRKVVAFASHGLIPGDIEGLNQPALALSSPAVTGSTGDDGVLTMGEVLRLELNADWVVLSACSTGAGQGAGAEAVSGLGRAFFFAGTRAVLVSMWPVETVSARRLTTGLFKNQVQGGLSRSQAIRSSILELMDGPGLTDDKGATLLRYAHPLFWAPFVIVGDNGLAHLN